MDDQINTRMSESVPDPLVGREIDGYRIEEIIGRGGMGVVYKATQQSLGRPVAIKVLPEEVLENRQFLDRFEREVDILARLSHPNIVTVFERGVVDGRPYIAMELVRGTSLRDVMRKGPLPPSEALLVVRSVLSALEHAHDQGIVHRDIKPENVLVAPGGIVKVADFGLSRHLEGDGSTRLTKTYVALGTFEYMSPEQREMSRDADGRSDLYATGVVLYEMIAGELPIGSFEPLSHKRPNVCDARIDDVVDRSLKKSVDSRWQDARSMGDAVSRLLSNVPPEPIQPVAPAAPLETPSEPHGPKWKRALSNIFGHEIPVARIEGKLPRKFAEKVLEDVAVQRYLGKLVTLWPHFPGGVEFSKESSRLKIELGGLRGDDPVRDKRVAAAVGVVLEANAHGKLRRIAVADHAWEDANAAALASPPIVTQFEPIRPSSIPVQSQVVSGVERRHPGMGAPMKTLVWSLVGLAIAFVAVLLAPGGSGHSGSVPLAPVFVLCGIVAGASFIWFVIRGSRPRDGSAPQLNYWLSFAVTVLWVSIVAANSGNLRDEEIAWLCVGAIASVFLLPRIPALMQNAGRAIVGVLVAFVVLAVLVAGSYLLVGVDDMDEGAESAAAIRPVPAPLMLHIANVKGALPDQFGIELLEDGAVRDWIDMLVPGAAAAFDGSYSSSTKDGRLRVGMAGWRRLDQDDRMKLAAALGAAAAARAPGNVERAMFAGQKFEAQLSRSLLGTTGTTPRVSGAAPKPVAACRIAGSPPSNFVSELQNNVALRKWLTHRFPFAEGLLRHPPKFAVEDGVLRVTLPLQWIRERQAYHLSRPATGVSAQAALDSEQLAIAAAYGRAAEALLPGRTERIVVAASEHESTLTLHRPHLEPLAFPDVADEDYPSARATGKVPADLQARLRNDKAAWNWFREVLPISGAPWHPDPDDVFVENRDGTLVVRFDSAWRTRLMRSMWKTYGDMETARRFFNGWCAANAVAIATVLEARYPESVTRTRMPAENYRKSFERRPFEAK